MKKFETKYFKCDHAQKCPTPEPINSIMSSIELVFSFKQAFS